MVEVQNDALSPAMSAVQLGPRNSSLSCLGDMACPASLLAAHCAVTSEL